jgi:hypothetical protein
MSSHHTVPVIGQDGHPLTPTTPARAQTGPIKAGETILDQTEHLGPPHGGAHTHGAATLRARSDSNTGKGGQRIPYSRGTVRGLRKGLLIGTPTGKRGRLCGTYRNAYRYYDQAGKRQVTGTVAWVSAQYLTTIAAPASSAAASFPRPKG